LVLEEQVAKLAGHATTNPSTKVKPTLGIGFDTTKLHYFVLAVHYVHEAKLFK